MQKGIEKEMGKTIISELDAKVVWTRQGALGKSLTWAYSFSGPKGKTQTMKVSMMKLSL